MKKFVMVGIFALVLFLVPSVALAADIPVASGGDIAAAVSGASAGDRIILESGGAYTLTSQLIIDKDIEIIGAGEANTTIQIGFTSGSGAAEGAIRVNAGSTLTISGLSLTGTGQDVFTAIYSLGNVIASNLHISNIKYATYLGFGLRLMAGVNTVDNVEMANIQRVGCYVGASTTAITNFTYHGKGDGDWLDYGIEVERGGTANIDTIYIENCTGIAASDGSTSAGMLVTTYFNPGTTAHITNAEFVNNSRDVYVGYLSDDTAVVTIHNSILSLGAKIYAAGTGQIVDATDNYWGTNDLEAVKADLGNANILVDPVETRADPPNPQTGDSSTSPILLVLAMMAAAGAAIFTISKKTKV